MGSIYYDHKARRAFTTNVIRNPKTNLPERIITGEIQYQGEPPITAGKTQQSASDEAGSLFKDIQSFFLHGEDCSIDQTSRDNLARKVAWEREHGGGE